MEQTMLEQKPGNEKQSSILDLSSILQKKLGNYYSLIEAGLNRAANIKAEGGFFSKEIDKDKQNEIFSTTIISQDILDSINKMIARRKENMLQEKDYYEKKGNADRATETLNIANAFNFHLELKGGNIEIIE